MCRIRQSVLPLELLPSCHPACHIVDNGDSCSVLCGNGGSGFVLGKSRSGPLVAKKQGRMQLIALNGLLVLVPCAVYLYRKASVGQFDSMQLHASA